MKKIFFSILVLLLMSSNSFASHIMGGDITYTCLGNNVYEVTLTLYRDCFGATLSTISQNVDFTSSCGNQNVQLPYVSTTDVSQICPTATSTCNGGTFPGTEAYVYTGQVTLPPCVDWTIYWSQCCRNAGITNLVDPDIESLYIQTTLNSTAAACNNSPQFLNIPTPYLCANNLAIYSHAASDIDGDSLYYSFNNPLTTPGPPGTPIAFAPGYSLNQPVITTSGMNFDQTTGEMCFTPSQGQICVISVLVEEYRNGVLIGTQIREMQVVIDPTCTNQNPTTGVAATCGGAATLNITQQGPSVTQTDPNSVIMCPNENICFEVDFSDPDNDNITITSNVATAIPGATFTVTNNGTPNPVATFCWIPTPLDSGLNAFAIIAQDDACPVSGTQSFVFDVTVFDQPYAGPDDTICGNQGAQLNASGGAGYSWSVISGDPIVVGTNFSCNPCTNPIATPSVTTTYLLTSTLLAACENTDTVTVVVVPDITLSAYGDTLLCDYLSHGIGVNVAPNNPGYTYNWSPAATLNNTTVATPTASPIGTTDYIVEVASPLGCVKQDTVTIDVNPPPDLTLYPGDTTICQGDAIPFDVVSTCEYTLDMFDTFGDGWNGQSLDIYENGVLIGNYTLATGSADSATFSITNGSTITIVYNTGAFQSESSFDLIDGTGTVQFSVAAGGMTGWVQGNTYFTGTANCGPTLSNYTFSWSPAAGLSATNIANPIATPAATTTYTVTLTDAGGCSVDRTQTITVVPNYTLTTTQSDSSVCLNESVDFTANASGAGPYNYSWTPAGIMNNANSSNPTATFNTSGLNMVTVLVDNGGGCIRTDTMYVNVTSVVAPDITILTPDSLMQCGDSIHIQLDLGGGTPAVSGPSANNLCSGPTSQSTIGAGTTNISSPPTPYNGFYEDGRIQMLYTAAELNAMGFTGGKITEISFNVVNQLSTQPYSGLTIKIGPTALNDFAGAIDFVPGLTQVYTNAAGYSTILGWNVHVLNTAYEWDGVSNLIIEVCFDNASWTDNDDITQTGTLAPMTIFAYDDGATGCTLDGTTWSFGTSLDRTDIRFTHCPTTPDTNALDFSWNPMSTIINGTDPDPTVFPSTPTQYIVTVSDTGGNCFDTDTLNIDVTCGTCFAPNPTWTNITCKDGTNGEIIIDPVFVLGSEVQNFTWTDSTTGVVLQTTNNVVAGMQDTLSNLPAGTYIITMTDSSGCSADTTITLTEPDSVLINNITANDIICIGGSKQIDATATGGNGNPYTYFWTDLVAGNAIPGNGPHTVFPTADPHCYEVYAEDALGCISDTQQVCIVLHPALTASSTDTAITICHSSSLANTSTNIDMSAVGGSGSGYNYNWYENGVLIGSGGTINVTPTSSPTTYIGVATDNCTTPADSVAIVVDWFTPTDVNFTKNRADSCYPITVELQNVSNPMGAIANSSWSISDGTVLNGDTVAHLFGSPVCHDVTLTVTDTSGCVFTKDSVNFVCPHPYPEANFYMTPPITNVLNTEIDFTNLSTGNGLSYLWNFGSGLVPDSSSVQNPTFVYPDDTSGTYNVLLTVTNQYGCVNTINGTVFINSVYLFYIPNSFTPDGDGKNEFFRPEGEGIDLSLYTMQIFNRWGELLYEAPANAQGWNGTYNGSPVQVDTYVWRIVAKELDTPIIHENYGHVNLIR